MSLPAGLRPYWPHFKRIHRLASFLLGFLHRSISPLGGHLGVPTKAYGSSREAAAAEPRTITLVGAGEPYRIARGLPSGEPAEHAVFVAGQSVDVDERYVLDVAGGRLVGDFGALVTPSGRLDYQTSTYFGLARWREHPLYLKPTLGKNQEISGRVLSLTSPGVATNYYHFLYDAIGRLQVVEASGIDRSFDAIVVPHATRYQRELLELVGVTEPLVQLERGHSITAETLVVPSTPNSSVIAPRETVAWLRDRLLPDLPGEGGGLRIFITRGNAPGSRRYLQEDDLWPELEDRGFVRVDPGSFSVREQIAMFAQAAIVVSPHGAGLTNITFAPPGVKVLEFFAPAYVHLGLWGICAVLDGVDYRYLVGDDSRPGRARLPRPFDDISLAPERIVKVVDEMIADRDPADPRP